MSNKTVVEEKHLKYLDRLKESNEVNMFAASEYIEIAFDVSKKEARDILVHWMETYEERHG